MSLRVDFEGRRFLPKHRIGVKKNRKVVFKSDFLLSFMLIQLKECVCMNLMNRVLFLVVLMNIFYKQVMNNF